MRRLQHLGLLTLFVVCASTAAASDVAPIVVDRSEQKTLVSKENGVAYKLYVSLPHGYGDGAKRFPVVYLLDADYSFFIARNITDHLSERNDLPEVILVGIAYDGPLQYKLNRTRDYTPKFVPTGGYGPEFQKVSGGGPKFRAFIEKELIPFIDRTYATIDGDRCLVGHSYGGLFAAWNLRTGGVFRRYIIVSPSLWYSDRWLFGLPVDRAASGRVYMAVGSSEGNSEHDMVNDLQRFAKTVRERVPHVASRCNVLDAETHNSVFPRALSNGLRFVFEER